MTLLSSEVIAFLATTQPEKARAFYCDVLGLRFEEDGPFALVVQTSNATVRIQKVQAFTPLPFTALGWKVTDMTATVGELEKITKHKMFWLRVAGILFALGSVALAALIISIIWAV